MARHQRMPTEEAGYTFAVEPAATNRLLANEEESIYRRSGIKVKVICGLIVSGLCLIFKREFSKSRDSENLANGRPTR